MLLYKDPPSNSFNLPRYGYSVVHHSSPNKEEKFVAQYTSVYLYTLLVIELNWIGSEQNGIQVTLCKHFGV